MLRFGLSLCLLVWFSSSAAAEEIKGECGSARFNLRWEKEGPAGYEQPRLLVQKAANDAIVWFDGVDFVGAECRKGKGGVPMIVLQAYCGGSACRDLDNFGIVDPDNLKLLLLPTDDNRGRAATIMGGTQKQIEKMLSRHDGS